MTADKRLSAVPPARVSGSLGGSRSAANMTPEERSERARKAASSRWQREDAKREAEGLPPRRVRPSEPSAAALEPWLREVDRRWPDREWPNRDARRRQAILLLRTATAEAITQAMRGNA